jgi:protein SCO1/2
MLFRRKVMTGGRSLSTTACLCTVVATLLLALTQANAHEIGRAKMGDRDADRRDSGVTHQVIAHAGHMKHSEHVASERGSKGYRRSVHRYPVPAVTLVDMDGADVFLPDALSGDSPTMMNFIFTSCTTICPVLSMTFSRSQEGLADELDDMKMISISIDPEHDTPERLREYAQRHHAGAQWRFLTGSRSNIVTVQKAFDAFRGSKMSHEPFTLLRASVDAPWVRLDGFASAAELVAEYRQAFSP